MTRTIEYEVYDYHDGDNATKGEDVDSPTPIRKHNDKIKRKKAKNSQAGEEYQVRVVLQFFVTLPQTFEHPWTDSVLEIKSTDTLCHLYQFAHLIHRFVPTTSPVTPIPFHNITASNIRHQ